MKKYLALLAFAAKQTPAYALSLLKQLNIKRWEFRRDGVLESGYQWKFKLVESFEAKMLVIEGVRNAGTANEQSYVLWTRFKNDGSDRLKINGVEMGAVDLDFDVIGWTDTVVQVEMRYLDENANPHEDKFFNQF